MQYLDKQYPDTPTLIPEGTAALQAVFADTFFSKVRSLYFYMNIRTYKQLNPASQEHWRRTREATFGVKLEEIAPEGSEKAKQLWGEVLAGLTAMAGFMSAGREEGPFVMGEKPTFADVVVASVLTWAKRLLGENSKEWKEILEADGGVWARYVDAFAKWEKVDEEGLKTAPVGRA